MSSLMQFGGKIQGGKVHLMFYLVKPDPKDPRYQPKDEEDTVFCIDAETEQCPDCGRMHPVLWVAPRKPVKMWGCWVVFRWNGAEHAPDLSVPIRTRKLPRDAKRLPIDEAARYWHGK